MNWLLDILGDGVYYERLACLNFDPRIAAVYVACDVILVCSAIAIGGMLILRRDEITYVSPVARVMVALVILCMGLGYATSGLTIFIGVYRLDLAIKSAAAGLAGITAYYVVSALIGGRRSIGG